MKKTNQVRRISDSYNLMANGVDKFNPAIHQHQNATLSTFSSISRWLFPSIIIGLILLLLVILATDSNLLSVFGIKILKTTFKQRLSFALIFQSIYFAIAILALAIRNFWFKNSKKLTDLFVLITLVGFITPLSLIYSFNPNLLIILLLLNIFSVVVSKNIFKDYSYSGLNFYFANCINVAVISIWGYNFIFNLNISATTQVLLLSATPFLMVIIPSKLLHLFELYDIVCREHWKRPRHMFPESWHKYNPFVSIHVPTYSEPPEIVIETLKKISEIDYENYEVIVIDNNTKDENLWLPVQKYCDTLGSKFRFIHADGIKGAKGGALNYIHKFVDPRTEIIGVIDADYHVNSTFLKSLVGHFQHPNVGFVQSPHDYRDWQHNLFLTMCYWEYQLFFHTAMISLNEHEAGITVGTMCLVRKEALEKAGGWSEWCVTEDSELAIRMHDVGYTSVYIDKTFGRGLIPETFGDYKTQRYRWTAGPIQELRHYYRHFIGLSKADSELSLKQRIFHLNHGLGNALSSLNIPMIIIGMCTVVSLIMHNELIVVPIELWIVATIALISTPLLTVLLYRVTIKATLRDILLQAVATTALSHVVNLSALKTMLTGNAKWVRTNKFSTSQTYFYALTSTKEELIIGVLLLIFVILAFISYPFQGLSTMLLIGVSYLSLSYFTSPFMALVGVWSNRHQIAKMT